MPGSRMRVPCSGQFYLRPREDPCKRRDPRQHGRWRLPRNVHHWHHGSTTGALLESTVVVVSVDPMNRNPIQLALEMGSRNSHMNVSIRAHYPGPWARRLTATLSQYTASGLGRGEFSDQHVCGTIPPVLASRQVTAPRATIPLRPLSFFATDVLSGATILANSGPNDAGMVKEFSRKGIKDIPEHDDAWHHGPTGATQVSIAHMAFRFHPFPTIGDVFQT